MASRFSLQRHLTDQIDSATVEEATLNPYTAAGFIAWYCFLVVCCVVPIICLSIRFFCKRCSVDEETDLVLRNEDLDRQLSQIEANVNLFSEIQKCRKMLKLSKVLQQGTKVLCIEDGNVNQGISSDKTSDHRISMECLICLGNYQVGDEVIRSPSCKHMFHKQCILEWLSSRPSSECPCCRQSFVEGELDLVVNDIALQDPVHVGTIIDSTMQELDEVNNTLQEQFVQHQTGSALPYRDVQEQNVEHGIDVGINNAAIQEQDPRNAPLVESKVENLKPSSDDKDNRDRS